MKSYISNNANSILNVLINYLSEINHIKIY